ncbi:MAG TPA: right-handed parallel beta-helix repeat-containing protein, partial [Oculatellaceae cyanobacterium]
KSQSKPSCTVDYGVFYSVPITVEGGSPKIANSYFTSTSSSALITVNSGAPSITGNVLSAQSSQNGIHINSGFVTITSNIITGARYGIYNAASTAPITSNTITSCFSGIYTTGPATIQQNIIANNSNDGIVTTSNPDILISSNAIAHNTCGISRDANIQNNTISQNTYGLWGQTGISTIRYNNIMNSGSESVHLTEDAANVDATNNWWGTTDETSISLTISDSRVDPDLGTLTFKPFLTLPANAPAVPASIVVPTPPPTPTTSATTTPTATPNTNSSATPTMTPTPTIIVIFPTYTPYPYQTIIPTPYQTSQPIQPTTEPEFGGFSLADVMTAAVIVVAVCLAVTIIVVLNGRFGQAERQQVKP